MTDRYWLFGKIQAHMETARSIEKFAYGVSDRKIGPSLPWAAR